MGHVLLGFSDEQMHRFLTQAGFDRIAIRAVPPSPEAKGPALFAASAAKSTAGNEQLATNN
jgi:hypothetical protein